MQAHVIRMTKPFDDGEVAIPHYHDVEFQMVYVLKGWFKSEFEGEGVHTFQAGSCWIQPPRIKHTVRGYSDDCELLEIVLPAEFETVTVEELTRRQARASLQGSPRRWRAAGARNARGSPPIARSRRRSTSALRRVKRAR